MPQHRSGLLLFFCACLASSAFAAAGARGFSAADVKTLKGADGTLITLSCYFGSTSKGCPPAAAEAPDWLREDLPAMRARDCQHGATTEARAWATALGDIGYFIYQARAAGEAPKAPPKKKGAKAPKALDADPKKSLPVLKQIRAGFAKRTSMMQERSFSRSLRGRGSDFLGRFRYIQDKMDEAISGIEKGDDRKFREATLSVAWEADELKKMFHSEPSNPFNESGPPDCTGLELYEGRTVPASPGELTRLTRMGLNYKANGDLPKAMKALEMALPMSEALGDAEAQEELHRAVADVFCKQGNSDLALPHMEKALEIARNRNDLVSERDLLKEFASFLKVIGREDDVRANYEDQAGKVQRRIETALEGYQRGERFFTQGRYLEAKREYLETGQLGHALSFVKIGVCEQRLGDVEAAVAADLEALKLARLQGKKPPEAMALQALAGIYNDQNNTVAAMDSYEDLLRMAFSKDLQALPADLRWQLESKRPAEMAILENLYNLADRWDRAQKVFAEMAAAARAIGLRDEALRSQIHLARALVAGGSPEKGVDAFAEALRTATNGSGLRVETLEFLHRSLFGVQPYWNADTRAFAGQFVKTLTQLRAQRKKGLEEDLAAAKNKKDRTAEMQALFALGAEAETAAGAELGHALEEGSFEADAAEKAIGLYEQALGRAEQLRRQDYQIACWRGIARMHAARQEWDGATEPTERAVTALLWKDGRPLREIDPSFKSLDSAIALKLGDPDTVGELLRELGYAYLGSGTPITAIDFIRRALSAQTSEIARMKTLTDFARLLESSGYTDPSVTFLERLLTEGRVEGAPRLKAAVLLNLARVQARTGGLGEDFALERLEQGLNLLQPRGLNSRDIPLLLALADLRLKKGKTAAAADAYETAIGISEQFRAALASESARLAFMEKDPTHAMNYQVAIGGMFAAAHKDPVFLERAFAAAEKARARVLLESLRGAALEREGPLRKDETALTQRLAMLAQKGLEEGWSTEDSIAFSSLQDRLTKLGDDIRRQDPQYASLRYGQPAGLREVQEMLKPGEALVSYKFAGREGSAWAFVLQAGKPGKLIALDTAEVLAAARTLPPPEPRRATEVYEAVPERLGRALWDPFAKELEDAKKVFIVPDGELWTIPWPVLESGGKPLLDKSYTVQVVPSGSVLVQIRRDKRVKADKELIAFAPFLGVAPTKKMAAIPGATEVLDNLKWNFPGSKVFTPPLATKENAIAESGEYKYVVYYTHGLADETNPWLSSIYFTDTKGVPVPLTVTESMKLLKLDKTDLVVLAACESARGQLSKGEGVMGLTRGLFYAGARGVISTGWSVAEASSRDIVIGTFQGIHLGLDPAKALQMAQRDVRKRKYNGLPGSHPFFWGGFQVYGDPE